MLLVVRPAVTLSLQVPHPGDSQGTESVTWTLKQTPRSLLCSFMVSRTKVKEHRKPLPQKDVYLRSHFMQRDPLCTARVSRSLVLCLWELILSILRASLGIPFTGEQAEVWRLFIV